MIPETQTPVERVSDLDGLEARYLLMKRGLFYAPNAMGYTGIRDKAGRYSEAEAKGHADEASGVTAILEADAPLIAPNCFDDIARDYLITRLRAAEAATAAAVGWQDISTAPRDGTPVLVSRPTVFVHEEGWHVVRWDWQDGAWTCHDGKNDTALRGPEPTHWTPLPSTPVAGEAK